MYLRRYLLLIWLALAAAALLSFAGAHAARLGAAPAPAAGETAGKAADLALPALATRATSPVRLPTPTPTLAPNGAPPHGLLPTPTLSPTPLPTIEPPTPAGAYRVKAHDTLLTIAIELNLDLADAYCLVAPTYKAEQPLVIGNLLTLLPDEQICHAVEGGETLAGIAARYATAPAALRAISWNNLAGDFSDITVLPPGRYLRVPRPPVTADAPSVDDPFLPMLLRQPVGATADQLRSLDVALINQGALPVGGPARDAAALLAPVPEDWPYGSGAFAWPLYGWLTQDYHGDHRAIDVAAPAGTLVTAADRGRVLRAGWSDQGYGYFVVIDHNIDYVTVYGHLSEVLVKEGDIVAQGAPIGRVGSTGNSTGPHLHFEIRDFGQRIDPVGKLVNN